MQKLTGRLIYAEKEFTKTLYPPQNQDIVRLRVAIPRITSQNRPGPEPLYLPLCTHQHHDPRPW